MDDITWTCSSNWNLSSGSILKVSLFNSVFNTPSKMFFVQVGYWTSRAMTWSKSIILHLPGLLSRGRFQICSCLLDTVKLGISAFLKICNHHILWSEKVPWDILRIAVTIINYHKMGSKKILAFFFKTISSCVWFHSFQYGGSKNQSVVTAVRSAAAAVEQCASNRRRPSVLLVVLPIRDSNQKCIQQT